MKELHWILDTPLNAAELRFGIREPKAYEQRLRNYNAIRMAEGRLRSLVSTPFRGEAHSLGAYAQMFYRLAIEVMLHSFLGKTNDGRRPTAHCALWLSQNESCAVYELPLKPVYGGRQGTLAFYLNALPLGEAVPLLTLIEEALIAFWGDLDYLYTTPAGRQQLLLQLLNLDTDHLWHWQQQRQRELKTNLELRRYHRGSLIPEELHHPLAIRLLLGEYDAGALEEYLKLHAPPPQPSPLGIAAHLSRFWPPAGPVLAYAAFALEGFYKAALVLKGVPQEALSLRLPRFVESYPSLSRQISWALALSYDALFILNLYHHWSVIDGLLPQLKETLEAFLPANETLSITANARLNHRLWYAQTKQEAHWGLAENSPYEILPPPSAIDLSGCVADPEVRAQAQAQARQQQRGVWTLGNQNLQGCTCTHCQPLFRQFQRGRVESETLWQRFQALQVASFYRQLKSGEWYFQTATWKAPLATLPVRGVILTQAPTLHGGILGLLGGKAYLYRRPSVTLEEYLLATAFNAKFVSSAASPLVADFAQRYRGALSLFMPFLVQAGLFRWTCLGGEPLMQCQESFVLKRCSRYPGVYLLQFLEPLTKEVSFEIQREGVVYGLFPTPQFLFRAAPQETLRLAPTQMPLYLIGPEALVAQILG